ncbi:MAG: TIGR00269 family protein [Candidatus Odinarchaeum yellowstonii]|uniref:TIGR00269 family protein n=1 Tax=Odinarchaeota yellowstonii (strain LCB_4) TaxID=1841599 RepID=A0AAF0D2Y2_ODILC|nr:MAG: TIGR00269 family protein [Candidatus Odinarchaeum yellowstonii]
MVKCFYCKNEAVTFRPYSGEYLCKPCFLKSVERKVQRTINKYSLLDVTDTVAVAVSGGKDSLTLLTILSKLEQRFHETKLIAVTIDEGIKNYREESLNFAKAVASKLGVEHRIYSFKNLFGYNFDEVIATLREYSLDRASPCSYCGLLRRTALNIAAKDVGATKLATAHNLDDEAQTVIMNFLRADYIRALRTGPRLEKIHPGFIPRVKPLIEIPEREIILYAYFSNIPLHSQTCPYAQDAFRNDVRAFLNRMEVTRPEVKYNILRINDRLRSFYTRLEGQLNLTLCVECGEPASQELCKKCQLLKILNQLRSSGTRKI